MVVSSSPPIRRSYPSIVAAIPYVLMVELKHISLIIHYRGRFEHDSNGVFAYVDGETEIVDWVNLDCVSGELIKDILSKIGYPSICDLYWL
ncbi:hypothetical protein PIB30_046778 [Stylosanthes scabra]|uniref:PB1-like domain-containing protein n=1 Tax=Stylosanthes scabra TaxID=79078 RepID=A0ABU6XEA5_9FABA|nr:hypothetical protein [Stylosanthes scabra]